MQVIKEEVRLIEWKAGLLTGMLPWSNDSPWEEDRHLLPDGPSPIPSNLQFAPDLQRAWLCRHRDALWQELVEPQPGPFSQTSQPFPSSSAQTGAYRE